MLSGPHWWKPCRKQPIGKFFMNFFVVTSCKGKFSAYYMMSLFSILSNCEYTLFELRYFCCLAPLEHWADAIQLSEEVFKVLRHLSWTFSSHKKRLPLRRLWSKFKGAILTNMLLKDLVIRTGDLWLMFWFYIMLVHVVRSRLVLIFWKSVPLLISYDVICVKILHPNNFTRF